MEAPGERARGLIELVLQRTEPRRHEIVAEALRDPDVDVLSTAAALLARIGTPSAVRHLLVLALRNDAHAARRVVAIWALGHLPFASAEACAALRKLSASPEPWVRSVARDTLRELARGPV